MEIVIDIPDKVYSFITTECNDVTISENEAPFEYIIRGIIDGTVLPKGHGRLIDADDLIQDIIDDSQLCIFNSECERIVHDKMTDFAVDRITEASPIIKADKGGRG